MFNTNKFTTERSSASSGSSGSSSSSSSPTSAAFSSPTTPAGPLSSFTTPSALASPLPSLVASASTTSTSASTSGGPSSRSGASTAPSYVTPTSGPGSLVGMAVRAFPRTNWDGVIFDGDSTDPRDQTEWAGREASKRWAAALEAGDLGNLDTVDFGVAVFDHVCEPIQRSRSKQVKMSAHTWVLTTNVAIEFSFKAAEWCLREAFPKNPRVGSYLNRTRVIGFVREALNWQWVGGEHGGGKGGPKDRPPILGLGTDWIERFLPGYIKPDFDPAEMDEEDARLIRRVKKWEKRQSIFMGRDWMERNRLCARHRGPCSCYRKSKPRDS